MYSSEEQGLLWWRWSEMGAFGSRYSRTKFSFVDNNVVLLSNADV